MIMIAHPHTRLHLEYEKCDKPSLWLEVRSLMRKDKLTMLQKVELSALHEVFFMRKSSRIFWIEFRLLSGQLFPQFWYFGLRVC